MDNYPTLTPDTRKSLVQNLVMLRNKSVITSIQYVRDLLAVRLITPWQTFENFIPIVTSNHVPNSPSLHPQDHRG